MAYTYGKTFRRNGKLVRYRYTNKKKSTKKLVDAPKRSSRKRSQKKR